MSQRWQPESAQALTEPSLFVLDGNVLAGRSLVLSPNEVGDLLVLGLLHSGL